MENGVFSYDVLRHAILINLNIVFFKHSEQVANYVIPEDFYKDAWDQPITLGHFFSKLPVFKNGVPYYEPFMQYGPVVVGDALYKMRIVFHKPLGISVFTLFDLVTDMPITSFTIKNADLFIDQKGASDEKGFVH